MPESLNDRDLILLVQEKTPDELTEEEIDLLRARLHKSAELRDVLLGQLHLETYLNAALGRFEVSIDDIVQQAGARPVNRISRYWRWTMLLLLGLGGGGAVYFGPQQVPPKPPAPEVVAVVPPTDLEPGSTPETPATSPIATVPPATPAPTGPAVPGESEPWRIELEAENFARGDVRIDRDQLGKGIGVLRPAAVAEETFVEFDVDVPAAGAYQIDFRYAAGASGPQSLRLNGELVKEDAAKEDTGNWRPTEQQWFVEGMFNFKAGRNVLRISPNRTLQGRTRGRGRFPALDKLAIANAAGVRRNAAPSPPASVEPEPWDAVALKPAAGDPVVLASFASLREVHSPRGLAQTELVRWLEPALGQNCRFHAAERGAPKLPVSAFEGIAHLRAPWVEAAVWQFSAFDHHGLQIHFWAGRTGVTLQYFQEPRPTWVAYASTRTEQQAEPSRLALLTTDDGRAQRCDAGPVELRYQNGKLILARGPIRLLTVPFDGFPEEVYLQGKAWFRGMRMYRDAPWPDEPPNPHPYVLRSAHPARMAWKHNLPTGATLQESRGGALELRSEKSTQRATVAVQVPNPGLYEVILRVENAEPGTGIYLGDATGRPLHRLGFFLEDRTRATAFAFLRGEEVRMNAALHPQTVPFPFAGQVQWLRLVLGHGSLKCWTSGDGIHWGRACDPLREIPGGFSTIGLFCDPGETRRAITLAHLEVRELNGLTNLIPTELRDRTPVIPGNAEIEVWLQAVLESEPEGVDPAQWRRACALRTLSHGTWGALGRVLLDGLLEDLRTLPLPLEARLQGLDDALLIADTWEPPEGMRFAQHYTELGRQLIREGSVTPYTSLALRWRTAPFWTTANLQMLPDSLVRMELFAAIHRQDWESVWGFCQEARYWNEAANPDVSWPAGREATKQLVQWAEVWAVRSLPARRSPTSVTMPVEWRHPVLEELSKEGYNILAEFEAALEGEAYRDACQIISAAREDSTVGLLPDAHDRSLLVSLPRAVALAMREKPALAETMNEVYGPVGRIRVRQAQADRDATALRAATVQFTGTPAAAEAHAWLGDRALAAGGFAEALGEYQQATRHALPQLRATLATKLRLAHAMLGQDYGGPPTTEIEIAGNPLTPEAFELLVADMRRTHDRGRPVLAAAAPPAPDVPAPSGFAIGRRMLFEGDLGQNAGSSGIAGLDAVGRSWSAVIQGDVLYVSSRFQINAYNLTTGALKWAASLAAEQGDARSWPMRPMRPVFAGDRLLVRWISKQGPEIACLRLETGEKLWSARPGDHAASDPLFVQDELFVLCIEPPQGELLQLSLMKLDLLTGEVTARSPLLQMRDAWGRQVPCDVTAIHDQLVIQVAGSVLCCDLFGRSRWLRRQTWVPPYLNDFSQQIARQPPLVAGQRVFSQQPGVPAVDCLDLESGRLRWRKTLPELRRLVGISRGLVLVETIRGLLGVDGETGATVWQREMENILEATWTGTTDGPLLIAAAPRLQGDLARPELIWIDPATGTETARAPLFGLEDKQPMLGPMVVHGANVWTGFARGIQEPRREWVELVPAANVPAQSGRFVPELTAWTTHVAPPIQAQLTEKFPGWQLLTWQSNPLAGLHPQRGSRNDVFVTQATAERPAVLARRITLPADKPRKLQISAGLESQKPWNLGVRINGQTQFATTLDATQTPQGWGDYVVDLTPFAGQTVWIFVSQTEPAGEGFALWERLAIIE